MTNDEIIKQAAERLGIPMDKVPVPVAEVCDLNEHAKYIEFLSAGRDLEAGTLLYVEPPREPREPFEVAIAGSLWLITPPDAAGWPRVEMLKAVYP